MTAFAAIYTRSQLSPDDQEVFQALTGKLASQKENLACEFHRSNNMHSAKLWLPHSRTQGFANDKATGSWLACIGNPSYGENVGVAPLFSRLLLRGYLADGRNAITSLNAPFVVVIYDGRDKSINVVTDRVGIQHIYMARLEQAYIFSTSSLALASVITVQIDRHSLANYFLVGHLLKQNTFFEEIEKIDAATWLCILDGNTQKQHYWHPPEEENGSSIVDVATTLSEGLKKAVSERICPNNRTSVELTGGTDSRVNLTCAALSGKPFHAWTIGDAESEEVRITRQLKKVQNFQHYVISPSDDLENHFLEDLKLINVLTDGEVDCLNLIASPSCNRQTSEFRDASISGVGGEILRGFYYVSHKGIPNCSKNMHTRRLITLKMLPNISARPEIFSNLFPSDYFDSLKQSVGSYFLDTIDKPLFWRLDDFYFRAREQRFAGRSSSFNNFFYRQELPFFDNDIIDMSFRMPWKYKKNSRIVLLALALCHPGYADVPLINGLPARPKHLGDAWRMLRYYNKYANRIIRKGRRVLMSKTGRLSDDTGVGDLVGQKLASEEVLSLLEPDNMASSFLYNSDRFTCFVKNNRENGFRDRVQIGLIISFELTCRYVHSSLRM